MNALRTLVSVSALIVASSAMANVDNAALPEPVRVPDGHVQKAWTVGIGEVTYACREKADQPGSHAWTFVVPAATLYDAARKPVGTYYGGPTWESMDGSKVTGKQVAIAPAAPGNLPLQLVKANPSTGNGQMADVSYIQRLKTIGGAAPAQPCDMANLGKEMKVAYQADYVFYTAR